MMDKKQLFLKEMEGGHLQSRILGLDAIDNGFEVEVIDAKSTLLFRKGSASWYTYKTSLPINSMTANRLAINKTVTNRILTRHNIPCPKHFVVSTKEEAVKIAKKMTDYVIKPTDSYGGKGVTISPRKKDDVIRAFKFAKRNNKISKDVIIESFLKGTEYRVLVLGNKVIGVLERAFPYVIGDGVSTVKKLINKENRNRRAYIREQDNNTGELVDVLPIPIDDELKGYIKEQGYTLDSVLKNMKKLILRRNSNISTGGLAINRTNDLHPSIAKMCVKSIKLLGLEFAGVDLITRNILSPFTRNSGVIEINSKATLLSHMWPYKGESINTARLVNNYLYKKYKRSYLKNKFKSFKSFL